jgi:hypothetical protein
MTNGKSFERTADSRRHQSHRGLRFVREWIIRVAIATLVLDWIFVPWTVFLWIDLGAVTVVAVAMTIAIDDA